MLNDFLFYFILLDVFFFSYHSEVKKIRLIQGYLSQITTLHAKSQCKVEN